MARFYLTNCKPQAELFIEFMEGIAIPWCTRWWTRIDRFIIYVYPLFWRHLKAIRINLMWTQHGAHSTFQMFHNPVLKLKRPKNSSKLDNKLHTKKPVDGWSTLSMNHLWLYTGSNYKLTSITVLSLSASWADALTFSFYQKLWWKCFEIDQRRLPRTSRSL